MRLYFPNSICTFILMSGTVQVNLRPHSLQWPSNILSHGTKAWRPQAGAKIVSDLGSNPDLGGHAKKV